ncbi:unnamed protein product [Amaranthus hypochondriacus]
MERQILCLLLLTPMLVVYAIGAGRHDPIEFHPHENNPFAWDNDEQKTSKKIKLPKFKLDFDPVPNPFAWNLGEDQTNSLDQLVSN